MSSPTNDVELYVSFRVYLTPAQMATLDKEVLARTIEQAISAGTDFYADCSAEDISTESPQRRNVSMTAVSSGGGTVIQAGRNYYGPR